MTEKESKVAAQVSAAASGVARQAEEVRKSATQIEASAGAVERSTDYLTESADRRTVLSANRTVLAAERTYAAWIRTGLVALASGIGAKALTDGQLPPWLAMTSALAMIVFSIFCFIAAVWRNLQSLSPPEPDMKRLPGVALILFSLLLSAVSLATLWATVSGTI